MTCQSWHLTGWTMNSLHSPFWRLYFNLDAGAWVQQEAGDPIRIEAGAAYLVPSGTHLSSGLERPVRHLFCHFLIDGDAPLLQRTLHRMEMDEATIRRLKNLAVDLLTQPMNDGENCPEIHAIVGAILADHGLLRRGRRLLHPGVGKVMAVLEARNYPAMDNQKMAELAGMSTNALIRAFAAETGSTPQHWLREKRIVMACHRLIHTADTIDQIAEAHGFANRYHFTRVFRAVRGVSPAAWRRECLRSMRAGSPSKEPVQWFDGVTHPARALAEVAI
ncbi:MAG: AraC family transcriptional regulator [Akkermansiaceae bacterium]|nr:AraC family transcriptional regulator [Akkermansiaceae bacterium]